MKTLTESVKISVNDRNLHKYFDKTKNGHILTFSNANFCHFIFCDM